MATPEEIAAALSGPDHSVTVADVERWISDGWRATPQAIIDANALGCPGEVTNGYRGALKEKLEGCAWEWIMGQDHIYYRVPRMVFTRMLDMQRELNEAKRAAVAALREHRAELAAALGTPEPDVTPQAPGVDSPPL